ncbi:GNAT family N-acetyltransferase [Zhongshania aquimaris]|uniref:N-acetyltransferase n=1 Tax=Zhongshania aquimaris TaxID=2857107 RepID=A0ABS6VNP1_9GAMM|nr:N-acetyltransferase [Zhongshania aquimaris]MBW2939937.1 N-acetyltransferase [Zhongshania aquimaris]
MDAGIDPSKELKLNIQICTEGAGDALIIHQLTERAFLNAPHTDHTEQFVVDALRREGALTISHVAKVGGDIIGHVAISPVTISSGAAGWFGLGPISVLPELQRSGVGSKLMDSALAALKSMGASGCVVLGDPAYYGRFGFKVVDGIAYPGAPIEYFQALSFSDKYPRGEVSYHEAFLAQG